jgi:hypothetical protein
MSKRLDRIAPMDETLGRRLPKYVRCYDNGGESIDRYTVVYTQQRNGYSVGVGMSGAPFHPQGFGQHFEYENSRRGNGQYTVDSPKYSHLGKKIKFTDLPEDCQRLVLQDYAELWNLKLADLVAGLSPASVQVAA